MLESGGGAPFPSPFSHFLLRPGIPLGFCRKRICGGGFLSRNGGNSDDAPGLGVCAIWPRSSIFHARLASPRISNPRK